MKQVLFITDDRLTAMVWNGTSLVAKYDFDQNEQGAEEFSNYLADLHDIQTEIIVDVLEEEISITDIPHVFGPDRKHIIRRAVERMHRAARYTYAEIIGRNKTGRKDDQLLVTALGSGRWIKRWLEIIDQATLRIHGIYSLPILTSRLLPSVKKTKGLALLISQQSDSFVRQSIFKDGKLFYSRNIPTSERSLVLQIPEDLKKTRKYLENQRLVTQVDKIDIVFLVKEESLQKMRAIENELTGMDFSYVTFEELAASLNISSTFPVQGREIFSQLLLSRKSNNHYARKEQLALCHQFRNNRLLNIGLSALLAVTVIVTTMLVIDAHFMGINAAQLQQNALTLAENNNKIDQQLKALPLDVEQMQVFVETTDTIKLAGDRSIEGFLVQFSQVMQILKDVRIENIDWKLTSNGSPMAQVNTAKQQIKIDASIDAGMNLTQVIALTDNMRAMIRNISDVEQVVLTKPAIDLSVNKQLNGAVTDKNTKYDIVFNVTRKMML